MRSMACPWNLIFLFYILEPCGYLYVPSDQGLTVQSVWVMEPRGLWTQHARVLLTVILSHCAAGERLAPLHVHLLCLYLTMLFPGRLDELQGGPQSFCADHSARNTWFVHRIYLPVFKCISSLSSPSCQRQTMYTYLLHSCPSQQCSTFASWQDPWCCPLHNTRGTLFGWHWSIKCLHLPLLTMPSFTVSFLRILWHESTQLSSA